MQRLFALLLICTAFSFGCGPKQEPVLYIYCSETFWYVMQEEALFFNKIYGTQIVLIPIRAERTDSETENGIEIDTNYRTPARWEFMQRENEEPTIAPLAQISPDIEAQIKRIESLHLGDLFISDSPRQLEMVRNTALAANDFPVCYLTLSMLVPLGNPHGFRSAKDVLDASRRLGIVNPSFDGLGEASWIVLNRIFPGGESEIPMELIHIFDRQYDLLEALELDNIDAALVWNATSQINFLLIKYADEYNEANREIIRKAERRKNRAWLRDILRDMYEHLVETHLFAEEVPLTENSDERFVVAVRLIALSSATNYGHCQRFADFMRSRQGKEILQRFGFVVE